MIADDFKIDFENKKIFHNLAGSETIYTVNELYSFLQDAFDEPVNMQYEIPIKAKSQPKADPPLAEKTKYLLINGWTIDEKSLKYLKGKLEKEKNV